MNIVNLNPYVKWVRLVCLAMASMLLVVGAGYSFIFVMAISFLFEVFIVLESRSFIKHIVPKPVVLISEILFRYLKIVAYLSVGFLVHNFVFSLYNIYYKKFIVSEVISRFDLNAVLVWDSYVSVIGGVLLFALICGSFLLEMILVKVNSKLFLKYSLVAIFVFVLCSISNGSLVGVALVLVILLIYLNEALLLNDIRSFTDKKEICYKLVITIIVLILWSFNNFIYTSLIFILLLDVNNYLYDSNSRFRSLILVGCFVVLVIQSMFNVEGMMMLRDVIIMVGLNSVVFFLIVFIFSFFKVSIIKAVLGVFNVWIK